MNRDETKELIIKQFSEELPNVWASFDAMTQALIKDIIDYTYSQGYSAGHKEGQKSQQTFTCKVKACHDAVFKGIDVLEMDDEIGFQREQHDVRPSNRIWLKVNDARVLYDLFTEGLHHD